MPTLVVFYAYAFEGAPIATTRGWFAAPGETHLLTVRSRTALGRASSEFVRIFRCRGVIGNDFVHCDSGDALFEGVADDCLRWFALYCARSVVDKWPAPDLMRDYLRIGTPALRKVAFNCAWAASMELSGAARYAARAAGFAASEERPLIAAREACRYAGQVAGNGLDLAALHQERALASRLLALIDCDRTSSPFDGFDSSPEMRPTIEWGQDAA